MQIIKSPVTYDVCIIGSGAGGGMAAKVLAEGGANVVMLEAGPKWDPVAETFPDDAEASKLLDRPRRKGYELPVV